MTSKQKFFILGHKVAAIPKFATLQHFIII